MNPTQLAEKLQIDPKDLRKFARKVFEKPEGKWNFNERQIQQVINHFQNQTPRATQSVAAPVKSEHFNITISELTEIARNWLKEVYNMDLGIPIQMNTRIKKRLGSFYSSHAGKPLRIEIGKNLMVHQSRETVIDVLKHELIHYVLKVQGKPNRDGHPVFENELIKQGVTRTGVIKIKGEVHRYICSGCSKVAADKLRKMTNPQRYRSRCCKGSLVYQGKVTV